MLSLYRLYILCGEVVNLWNCLHGGRSYLNDKMIFYKLKFLKKKNIYLIVYRRKKYHFVFFVERRKMYESKEVKDKLTNSRIAVMLKFQLVFISSVQMENMWTNVDICHTRKCRCTFHLKEFSRRHQRLVIGFWLVHQRLCILDHKKQFKCKIFSSFHFHPINHGVAD